MLNICLMIWRNMYGPISWGNKKDWRLYFSHISQKMKVEWMKHIIIVIQLFLNQELKRSLWYDKLLLLWISNRYAVNDDSIYAIFPNDLPESDLKRKDKSQINYILGDNPARVIYVVGAEDISQKSVQHRGSSGIFMYLMLMQNLSLMFILYMGL